MNSFAISMIQSGMMSAGIALTGKDSNQTGADDAVGQIILAAAPIVPDMLQGKSNDNAVLKAMRAIETTAHAYRVQVGDVTL